MNNEQEPMQASKDVIVLDGLFFIRASAIKNESEIIQGTLNDMYQHLI